MPVSVAVPKIVYVVTEDWYFHMHWLRLAKAVREAGYEVIVVTRINAHGDSIRAHGLRVLALDLPRSARYPWRDVKALHALTRIYAEERPALVHHLALKPVVVGSLAAYRAGIPIVINSLPGLGYVFSSLQLRAKVLRIAVVRALRWLQDRLRAWTIFQNPDDFAVMRAAGVVADDRAGIIRGAGVDLGLFRPGPVPPEPLVVVLASRLLWDKGVAEFVAAAQRLHAQGVIARFVLVGTTDPDNPQAVPQEQLVRWQREGAVEWWGRRDDMPDVLRAAHIVCLPSYREGLPMVLLEAAAVSLPVVTTDAPGCREVVRHGENGLLVPIKDTVALAEALGTLLADSDLRRRMGERGRLIAEAEFSSTRVAEETLALYANLLSEGRR
jgi:glycosyltransferase involved in cell wall biosynthesis